MERNERFEGLVASAAVTIPMADAYGAATHAPRVLAGVPFMSGRFPHEAVGKIARYVAPGDLAVADAAVVRSSLDTSDGEWSELWVGDSFCAYVHMFGPRGGRIQVYAESLREAVDRTQAFLRAVPAEQVVSDPDHVEMSFHYASSHGVATRTRKIVVPSWSAIRSNYTAPVAQAFDELAGMSPPDPASGRLLLVYGPPGTGKTTAVQALARAWQPWCATSYVLDPEQLFSSLDYLHQLVLDPPVSSSSSYDPDYDDEDGDGDGGDGGLGGAADRWRLLVIEDADEIIASSAKERTGQALSRLLNLTDGVVGRGTRTLVCITTNEPLDRLHSAVVRPGRCLAELEVGPLTPAEAGRWLGDGFSGRRPAGPIALAELFALRGDIAPVRAHRSTTEAPGLYL